MLTLKLVWSYVKKYWFFIAIPVSFVVGALIFSRGKAVSIAAALKQVNDAHDEEIRQIQAAREQERAEHLVNEEKLKTALAAVQKSYDDAMIELSERKKREVAELVKQYGDDPVTLAKKLSDATGFKVVLPE